jgi:hypothetical protein
MQHLIHVGLPKAGSTYLQGWFAAHPQLGYRPGGIAGFGCVFDFAAEAVEPHGRVRWRVTSDETLSAPRADPAGGRIRYDREGRSSIAEEQARACQLLAGTFPGATVLIVTRGFRSVTLSAHSEYVRTGGTELLSEILRSPPRDHPWQYDELIGLYRGTFGADRVIVLPFELLRDAPDRFLGELERRLGLDHFPYSSPPVNVGASAAELAWYPLFTRVARRLGKSGSRWDRLYRALLYRGRLARPARLLQRLRPQPLATADLVGEAFLAQFRGSAECLRDEPLYDRYRADYLL